MKPLDCRWTDVLSRHLLCTPTYPHSTAGSTFQGQSCFSLVTLPVTVQKWSSSLFSSSSFPMMAFWSGVALSWRKSSASVNSSTNKGISSFASTCNLSGWALLRGRWLSCPRIRQADHKQLYDFCPYSAANSSCWLTHQANHKPFTYLGWADVLPWN